MGEVASAARRRGLSLKSLPPFHANTPAANAATHPPLTRSPLPLKREGLWVYHKAALPNQCAATFAAKPLVDSAVSAAGCPAFLAARS
jgi:hypothetical protein